jgi:hypothetical protein
MLNVIEKAGSDTKMYVNVAGVSPVPAVIKNAGLPAAINTNEMFTLAEPDMTMFQSFSDNLKKKIMASPEWEKLQGKATPQTASKAPAFQDDEDIPF